jgi:hypothetical protein
MSPAELLIHDRSRANSKFSCPGGLQRRGHTREEDDDDLRTLLPAAMIRFLQHTAAVGTIQQQQQLRWEILRRSLSSLSADVTKSSPLPNVAANNTNNKPTKQSLITGNNSVHSTMNVSKNWRNKPLFRRQGDVRFKTGEEAAQLLINEAMRRDSHETEFIDSCRATLSSLAPIFDRNPKYAFVAKTLVEPERHIQFRVAWVRDVILCDDLGDALLRLSSLFRILEPLISITFYSLLRWRFISPHMTCV